jgi:glycosyltransferase involved in cell wall biosynthesis
MAEVLLTVSGVVAPGAEAKVAAGQTPRRDYFELARACGADLLDYAGARRQEGRFGKLLERIGGPDLLLAWACFRQRGRRRLILTDGEQIGIPLATLLKFLGRRGARHAMIVHILSVGKKMLFFDGLGIQSHVDRFLVYSTWQKRFIEERWRVPAERVIWTPFQADGRFFAPRPAPDPAGAPTICSVGLEFRDYPTLMAAVRDLPDLRIVIAAGSPWSKRSDSTASEEIPANVTVRRFTQYELRDLYAGCRFVVVPLYDVPFQAGVTTILEAMAMARAVIVTRTPGQTDVVVEGETGLYVPPGDPVALRQAIVRLLEHPDEAARLGMNGRRLLEERMSLDKYVEGVQKVVEAELRRSAQTRREAKA